jgi:para-nitrobenzyl esterase
MTTDHTIAPETTTTAGDVRGLWRGDSAAFLGIPFAQAPVGPYRFVPPVPHAAWDGVREATDHGPTPQRRPFAELPTIPEPTIPGDSTLNVDVFTPAPGDRRAHLPVFVWIHGGGFFAGSPASPWYDGRSFNRDGVVTVTISYRLGFDGFGWIDGGGFNRGLLDQIAALEWVHENIAAFGGDPDKVTIGGQSAGSMSVLALMAAPRARGLFRGVIGQSGGPSEIGSEQMLSMSRALADSLGIEPTLDGWRSLTQDQILDVERDPSKYGGTDPMQEMAKPIDIVGSVREMHAGRFPDSVSLAWAPTVDGELLPSSVLESIGAGRNGDVPLLMGSTRNEFPIPSDRSRDEVTADLAEAGVSRQAIARFAGELDVVGDQFATGQFASARMFGVGSLRAADARRTAAGTAGTWLYDFAGRDSGTGLSPHCADLPFSFDLLDAEGVDRVLGTEPSKPLADAMHADWVRFITDGAALWPTVSDAGLSQARAYDAGGSHLDPASYRFAAEISGLR